MKKIITLLIVHLLCLGQALAADPFTVAGVPVDATGDNAILAQTQAISEGQVAAAGILIDRLTLSSERAAKGVPPLTQESVAKLIRALDIANEKRSANRYLGNIKVAFNPSKVQQFLRRSGLTMVSTQSRTRLVLPLMSNQYLGSGNDWEKAWQSDVYSHALTPVKTIKAGDVIQTIIGDADARNADIDALRVVGQRYGVQQIVIADATSGPSGLSVNMTDVSLDSGQKRALGSVSGVNYRTAAAAVIESLEDDWKAASVSLVENAESMAVSVLYNSHSDWQLLQDAINGSAQIQDARLDALSKDGALMTLVYGGDFYRLKNELSFKGVDVRQDPKLGVVFRRNGRF